MFANYFRTALRNLFKYKKYSVINVLGLSIGMAMALLIVLYIQNELNFDRFHKKSDRIYRVVERIGTEDGVERHFGVAAPPLGPAMLQQFPEVEKFARLLTVGRMTIQHDDRRFYEEFLLADADFFEIFDFPVLQGNPAAALRKPAFGVLTAVAAQKYFGSENPIGQTLHTDRGYDFEIGAVIADLPSNSHLQFEVITSLNTLLTDEQSRPYFDRWDVSGFTCYVLLDEANDAGSVTQKLPGLLSEHLPDRTRAVQSIILQPLTDIHLGSKEIEADRNADKREIAYIFIFGAIALFILFNACINYMNLATAFSLSRSKEIGMRKVIGAQRKQLVLQFLSESIITAAMGMLLAYLLAQVFLPAFNRFTEKDLSLNFLQNMPLLLGLILITLCVGLASGSYPALYLSGFNVIKTLKGKLRGSGTVVNLRKSLVVAQMVLSVVMITSTLVALRQLEYVRSKELGFDKERMVVVDINSGGVRRSFEAMRNAFLQLPNVRKVSVTSRVPGEWKDIVERSVVPEEAPADRHISVNFFGVDEHFLDTFDVGLIDGRNFSSQMATDTTAVLINETAARAFGWDDAIGKKIKIPDNELTLHAIGVVKDFNFRSLHEKIGPLLLGHSHNPIHAIDYFTAKISGTDVPATLESMRRVHEIFDKITPFEYHFLDQQIDNFYRFDRQVSRLLMLAAGLAVFIACLGLFGLSAFMAEQRTKEIGVRKTLGASVMGIVRLLSFDFIKMVVIASAIAWPIAYFAMGKWLQSFAYRDGLAWHVFVLSGVLAVFVALLSVSAQATRAALTNPVEALRYE